jgi:hypothetical protein
MVMQHTEPWFTSVHLNMEYRTRVKTCGIVLIHNMSVVKTYGSAMDPKRH